MNNTEERVLIELDIARRLVDASARFGTDNWCRTYIERLRAVLELVDTTPMDPDAILVSLLSARISLLDVVPTAKTWIELARVVSPGSRLTIPKRLIGPVMSFRNELDIDAIATGAWIRGSNWLEP